MNTEKRQRKISSYGANKIVISGGTHSSFKHLTANGVVDNIIAKKQPQLSDLFSTPEQQQAIIEKADIILQNNKGKGVYLTPSQTKLVFAVAQIVDTQFNSNKELEDYIQYLPTKYEAMRQIYEGERVASSLIEKTFSVVIDVLELTKAVYGSKGGKQLALMRDELTALANTCHLIKMGKTTFIQPFIIIKGGAITESSRKIKIEIGDIFLYDIKKSGGYCLAPLTLLPLWNQYGDNSELTALLIAILLRVRGNYTTKAKQLVENKERELKKAKALPEIIAKELEKIGREALTYRESLRSLLDRLPNVEAYYRVKNGKKYFRKETADRNINKTGQSLVSMGIITEYYTSAGALGETIINLVINPKWLQEEKEYMQSLPNSVEIDDAEVIEE